MDKYLVQVFDLEPNPNNFTPIDQFKIYRDFDKFIETIKNYAAKNQLTKYEEFYLKSFIDPRRRFQDQVSQTHMNNYFLSIDFILTNPVLIKTGTFESLFRNRHLLPAIADYIIQRFETLDAEASKFYNKLLLEKMIKTMHFEPLPDDSTGPDYKTFFHMFSQEAQRVRNYLTDLIKDPKWDTHPEQGLAQFDPSIYQFFFELHTGLNFESIGDFSRLKIWAQKHLDHLMEEVNATCDRLLTNEDEKKKDVFDKMLLIGFDPSQRWNSKQEMIDGHRTTIEKFRRIFVDEYGFKQFEPPGLVVLDNPLLAGGYYYKNNFYLNVCEWQHGNFKYEVETLTLHETVPGHHLQIDTSLHSPHFNHLNLIDPDRCNGFIEGWGLFSEHLGDKLHDDPWTYFGYLQANILRTFRIVAEIMLHVEGKTPREVIELAKKYLTTSEQSITAEIYRYRVLPGQACSYKIGLEVFKMLLKQKFAIDDIKDFKRPVVIDWYKQLLWQTERPLALLLEENDTVWKFDF